MSQCVNNYIIIYIYTVRIIFKHVFIYDINQKQILLEYLLLEMIIRICEYNTEIIIQTSFNAFGLCLTIPSNVKNSNLIRINQETTLLAKFPHREEAITVVYIYIYIVYMSVDTITLVTSVRS